MTEYVVEVGPGTVRGPCEVDEELVSTALECIDDEIALLDEQPVAVAAIWQSIFRSVLADCVDTAVLVCPTWWPTPWCDRVREAAATTAPNVVVLQRAQVLVGEAPGMPTVVEVAPEFLMVWRAGCIVTAEPRLDPSADIARAVVEGVGTATAVLVDAPVGVDDAIELAGAISDRLRTSGVAVTTVHQDRVQAAVHDQSTPQAREFESPGWSGPRVAVQAAIVVSVALLCIGLAVGPDFDSSQATAMPMTLLVEGRVAVKVPAHWAVQRITSGPGSARVQVMAPDDVTAVLITQAQARKGESLSATAATLRRALDDQRAGVFAQFNPDDHRGERPAATYRELRDGRQIEWAVFVDDTVRVAVGCQSAPGNEQAVIAVCDEAIRSAHAIV